MRWILRKSHPTDLVTHLGDSRTPNYCAVAFRSAPSFLKSKGMGMEVVGGWLSNT